MAKKIIVDVDADTKPFDDKMKESGKVLGDFDEKVLKSGQAVAKIGAGMAGAFAVATGAVGAFGDTLGYSSEEIAKAQEKATSFIAIMTGVGPLIEGVAAAQEVLNIALTANPIGIIIVAIAALVAGLVYFRDEITEVIESTEFLAVAFGPLLLLFEAISFAIDAVTKELQELGLIESEEHKEAVKRNEERSKMLDEQMIKQNEAFDFEIAKANAAGENTFEIEQRKREAIIETIKLQADAILQQVKLTGEFTDEQREALKALKELAISTKKEEVIAVIAEGKKLKDKAIEDHKEWKSLREERAKEEQKLLDDKIAREDAQFQLLNELRLTDQQLEIQQLVEAYDAKFALAEGNAELEKELMIKQKEEIAEINQQYADLDAEAKRTQKQTLRELDLEYKELSIGELSDSASPEEIAAYYEARREALAEQAEIDNEELIAQRENKIITDEEYQARLLLITKNRTLQEGKLGEEQVAFDKKLNSLKVSNAMNAAGSILGSISQIAGEGSAIAKAAAVGQATMDTYKSAVAAYAAGSSVGGPAGLILGPVAAGLAVAAGILNVKKILSTKVPKSTGGGGGIGGAPSGGGAPPVPSFNLFGGGNDLNDVGPPGSNEVEPKPQVIKAVVSETDLTDTKDRLSTIRNATEL